MELDFCSFQIKIAVNFKYQRTEKFELSSLRIYNSQKLRHEALIIADYECVYISGIAVINLKFWMKEDLDLHTNHL